MEFVFERVLNALPASLLLVAFTFLLLKLVRGLNAATRHAAWWIVLVLILALPFRPDPEQLPVIDLASVQSTDSAPIVVDTQENAVAIHWLTAAVVGVMVLLLLRLVLHCVSLHWLKWRSPRLDNARVNEWRARGWVVRRVALRESARIGSPMVCGYLFPSIILPKDFAARTDAGDVDHVLLHELGHVARLDDFTQFLTRLVQAVAWWHPLVHVVIHQIDVEREAACDDWAVAVTGAPQGYAASLTRLMERKMAAEASMIAPGIGGTKSKFAQRIERLMSPVRNPRPRFAFGALGVALAMLIALAMMATRLPAIAVFAAGPPAAAATKGMSAGFLESLAQAGYKNLSVDEIIELKSQGVSGRYVIEITNAMGAPLKVDQLVQLRHRGVTPAHLKAAKQYGSKLTIEQVVRLKDAGAL